MNGPRSGPPPSSPVPRAPLVLASASPRRADLLRAAGIPFEVGPSPDVDETQPPGSAPDEATRLLAIRKASAVRSGLPGRVVLCADTLVYAGSEVLGKPDDPRDAVRMLTRLSGGEHHVATGVAVAAGARLESGVAVTAVTFRAMSAGEIEAYVASREPLDKAGAYAVQGGAAAFVESIAGDVDTVIGLPIALVRSLLARFD